MPAGYHHPTVGTAAFMGGAQRAVGQPEKEVNFFDVGDLTAMNWAFNILAIRYLFTYSDTK
jgi:hypothetical protein